jgi:hypothetical protein
MGVEGGRRLSGVGTVMTWAHLPQASMTDGWPCVADSKQHSRGNCRVGCRVKGGVQCCRRGMWGVGAKSQVMSLITVTAPITWAHLPRASMTDTGITPSLVRRCVLGGGGGGGQHSSSLL